jgi:hypothetical protein
MTSPPPTGISEPTASANVIATTIATSPLDCRRDQAQASATGFACA